MMTKKEGRAGETTQAQEPNTTTSIPTKAQLRNRCQDHEPGITNEGYWAAVNGTEFNEGGTRDDH